MDFTKLYDVIDSYEKYFNTILGAEQNIGFNTINEMPIKDSDDWGIYGSLRFAEVLIDAFGDEAFKVGRILFAMKDNFDGDIVDGLRELGKSINASYNPSVYVTKDSQIGGSKE